MSSISIILSIALFYTAAWFYSIVLQIVRMGLASYFFELYVASIIAGTVSALGCVVCTQLALHLLRRKISKETYFFIFLVLVFSVLGYVILRILLRIYLPNDLLVLFSILIAAPLSCVFAGYSRRTLWSKLRAMGLDNGVTVLTLLLLLLVPLIEYQFISSAKIVSTGSVRYGSGVLLQNGNDTAKVLGQIVDETFTATVPLGSGSIFEAKQVLNITNETPNDLDLRIQLEDLKGNLSGIGQFELFLTAGNQSEISVFRVDNGNVKYEEVSLAMKSETTITFGVTSLQRANSTNASTLSLLIRWDEITQSIAIVIQS